MLPVFVFLVVNPITDELHGELRVCFTELKHDHTLITSISKFFQSLLEMHNLSEYVGCYVAVVKIIIGG